MTTDLVQTLIKNRDDAEMRYQSIALAILAGDNVQVFGRRVRFTIEWIDPAPTDWGDEEGLQAWAREQLALIRSRLGANG